MPRRKKLTDHQKQLLNVFCKLVAEHKRPPTDYELTHAGARRSTWIDAFGSFRLFERAARNHKPSVFAYRHIDDVRKKSVPKRRRYIVTTAVSGHPVAKKALAAIKAYTQQTKAALLVLMCADPASNATRRAVTRAGYLSVPDELVNAATIVGANIQLNDNLMLHTFKVSAKMIDPTTGTLDLAHRFGTCVYASPKQRLRMVPTATEYPRAVMTPGAITYPDYGSARYMSHRTAALADVDHVMGALVIEVEDSHRFHFRQIQFRPDGSFVDLGVLYHPTRAPRKVSVDVVLGDLHAGGRESPQHRKARNEMLRALTPKHIVVHDVNDGVSHNHHERERVLTRAKKETSLRRDLENVKKELRDLARRCSTVVVVKSNHDEWLTDYLDKMRWARDVPNVEFAHELAGYMIKGLDPLAEFCRSKSVVFLARDESFVLSGVEVGQHGDCGPNGARGTPKNLSYSLGKAIVGHGHAPEIWRTLYRVGTSVMDADYRKGPSSWCSSHCVLDEFGGRQLINVIDGVWRLKR